MSVAVPLNLIEDIPDRDVVAEAVVKDRKRRKKWAPTSVDLAAAITNITITDTIIGSSTIEITIQDPDFKLMDSGFFDANKDGRLDAIDLNYPDGSRFWWRLTQCNPSASESVTLVFMERAAVHLMAHKGPEKTSRAKVTRAQFLKTLTDKVGKSKAKGVPRIEFHSKELKTKQEVEGGPKTTKKSDKERKDAKDPGINSDEDLKIQGATASKAQLRQAERALDVASTLDAPERAVMAMLVAGIGESGFKAIMNQSGSDYGGVFQGNVAGGVFEIDDTEGMARCFLKGGKGFQGGGAIALAAAHSDWGPGLIAVTVEGSRANFPSDAAAEGHYQKHVKEAEALLEAYGGGGFGGTTYNKQFNFTVGTPENPRETYWAAIQRLADEVKWPFFLDGQHAYFDSEMTLIRQKPAAIVHRDDPAVVDWNGTWDGRMIATEMTLDLIMEPFQFRAGEVLKLEGFGPYSSGSTATVGGKKSPLPGRWLIAEIERDRFRLHSTLTLKQPVEEELEPAPEQGTRDDTSGGSGTGGELQEICKKFTGPYDWGGHHDASYKTAPFSSGFDCSSSTAKALYEAGYYDEAIANVSGWFASSWGEAGEGSEFTVYANAGHVFIQGDNWRFDTGGPGGGNGPRYHGTTRPTAGFTARRPSGNPGKDKG
jgi:hypothetical protein